LLVTNLHLDNESGWVASAAGITARTW